MKVQCPNCHKDLAIPETYEGKKIRCAYCKEVIIALDFNSKKNRCSFG
jgi:DNA-directed RNA polymerase subunit RPC12/RpoP